MADHVSAQEGLLFATAGGYLRNPVRVKKVTCVVCTTPVHGGYERCLACHRASSMPGLADLVVPLTYAIARQQSATLMRHYKDDQVEQVRKSHSEVIRRLLYLGIAKHERCIATAVGAPISHRVTIPSTTGRPGIHPFYAVARKLKAVSELPRLDTLPLTNIDVRSVSPNLFTLAPGGARLDGQHILVLDDTWTRGARAQSAALTLRAHGAAYVSVMPIARWVDPEWSKNREFLDTFASADFTTTLCPVTGFDCPPQ